VTLQFVLELLFDEEQIHSSDPLCSPQLSHELAALFPVLQLDIIGDLQVISLLLQRLDVD